MSLPDGFHWGYATAAFQIEGSTKADGRGATVWDAFSHTDGKIKDGSNAEFACESYADMSKDIELMKGYGVTAYRFSLSWARIIPMGGRDDPINSKGIEYYSTLIDALLANGIRPFVTLLHWDVPLALYHRYGGMLNTTEFVQDFQRYADVCFANFGDRVKDWITFNEPVVVAQLGHGTGAFAPGRTSDRKVSAVGNTGTEPWRVIHTQILAHAHAARRYRTLNQGGQIGITFNADWAEPYSSSEDDIRAANRKLEFFVAVASDPIFGNGDYPESCKLQLGGRLPKFTSEEKSLIKEGRPGMMTGTSYTTNYIQHDPNPPAEEDYMGNIIQSFDDPNGQHLGPTCAVSWIEVVPWGLRKILNFVWNRYHVPIYITENGVPVAGEAQMSLPSLLDDQARVDYICSYLDAMKAAVIDDGVDVRSYFAWTLTDNWEWADGFTTRFGVTFVERDEKGRVVRYWPKKSASAVTKWFAENASTKNRKIEHTAP